MKKCVYYERSIKSHDGERFGVLLLGAAVIISFLDKVECFLA